MSATVPQSYAGGPSSRDGDARLAWALRTAVARLVASHINMFRQVDLWHFQVYALMWWQVTSTCSDR